MKYYFTIIFLLLGHFLFSQKDSIQVQQRDSITSPIMKKDSSVIQIKQRDSSSILSRKDRIPSIPSIKKDKEETQGITIANYKIISHYRDTTLLDTTLNIRKEYKYNYLRKDNFELMRLSNIGHTFNKLGVDFERKSFYPRIGAQARNYNYREIEDMLYYNVATPMTDLMFKTTFEEGQLLDALLTFNTSPQFNFAIGYKGFRSLGKYGRNQMESGNFTVTGNYISKNGRYRMRGHIAAQDIGGQENGGLSNKVLQFESGDEAFIDRSRIDVNLSNAQNSILGKRYYLDYQYELFGRMKDSINTRSTMITLGHVYDYETKYYQFVQSSEAPAFGATFLSPINDKASLKTMHNQFSLTLANKTLGKVSGRVDMYDYNYFFNSTIVSDTGQIDSQLKGNELLAGADYTKQINNLSLKGSITQNISGDLTGNYIDASVHYKINDNNNVDVAIHSSSRMPNYNYLLYQSEYINYNWQNNTNFEKEKVSSLKFRLASKFFGNITAKYSVMDNYTYFSSLATEEQIEAGEEKAFVTPLQEAQSINYLKVKYNREFKVGKFALDNTVMYQNVTQTNNVFNVPQLVTRNTLYYSNDVFKKAMYIQTGVIFKYFTGYHMDAYNPLMGEFYIQNNEELGGYPMLDFFINAKIRQTRVYFKLEHINSLFSDYNFYAAPDYPYNDAVLRFGLVWNFFS